MKAVGIILAGGSSSRMGALADKRAVAAMPVAGSFRCIDFALSSLSNSHCQRVAVCTQFNARSLNQHLNSSKWWDFGRKQGGLYLLTPTVTADNDSWYRGTADSMYQNIGFLRECHEPYVIISSGDCVYKTDFNRILDYHIAKSADITIAVTTLSPSQEDATRFGVVTRDEDGRVTDFEEKPEKTDKTLINAGIYIIRRRVLIEMLDRANREKTYDFVRGILMKYKDEKKIYAYDLPGYWNNIATVDSYYRTNMDFLKKDVAQYFFSGYNEIYTKAEDEPPAKYNPDASVSNSLIASGCIISGTVENSILSRKVYVSRGCVIRNSVILNDVYIGENTVIENCIVESRGTLRPNKRYAGSPGHARVVVEDNERYLI
ncbi:MAG: glucose-1-phosphate adenylyltransferase subunit GlgD [Lachnospiraceae bacterium]|nr:glucose-1-phosphate adenylyltransferase subunit GlgD [Lachnospiraceae bacterium]